ncbi:MAG: aldo/keto reductase [Gammaproteobacteria bacterium]|nr:aldo/keto reductase [Gammaproteobacteria bacterium]
MAGLDRRTFLQWGAATSAGASMLGSSGAAAKVGARIERYARLGRTDMEISDISFGSSRLREGEEDLVRHAIDRGVNYFDTADSYTGGQSERVIGNALKGRRDGYFLASKTQAGAGERLESIMATLDHSLRRLQTDYVDIYFNHAVNDVARLQNSDWYEFAERARAQGKIRFTGISGHGGHLVECLDYAVDHDAVDVVLVAHNFGQDPAFYERLTRSWDLIAKQPGLPGVLERAKARDIGVIAMKTLMGARLNDMRPFEKDQATFAQAAFRWTLTNPHVDALIISMTSQQRIDEYLGASGWEQLADQDFELLERYAKHNGQTYCRHACNDCEGACPFGVPIADVLRTRMYATDYQDPEFARREYGQLTVNASACLSCSGQPCQSACSHGLAIDQLCAPTHRMLA